jgi:aquaporin Z
VALIATNGAAAQLWLFWVAPLAGAALGGLIWKMLFGDDE